MITNKYKDYSNDALIKEIETLRADPRYLYEVDLNILVEVTCAPPPATKKEVFLQSLWENGIEWMGLTCGENYETPPDMDTVKQSIKGWKLIDSWEPKLKLLLLEARRRPEIAVSRCQNCDRMYLDSELLAVENIGERVVPGEPMPSGQCPDDECGAVCHRLPPLRREPNAKR